jgi:hypothetical protein
MSSSLNIHYSLLLGLSWDAAQTIMKRAVKRGLASRDISEDEQIGIDEKSFLKGHNYLAALNDLDQGRVLDVVQGSTDTASYDQSMLEQRSTRAYWRKSADEISKPHVPGRSRKHSSASGRRATELLLRLYSKSGMIGRSVASSIPSRKWPKCSRSIWRAF